MADETLTAVGKCEAVTERNGWTQFEINIGRKFPLKLSTKLDEVIIPARAVGSDEAIWSYSEQEGGPNPHKPGTNFVNRYLSGAELVTAENREAAAAASFKTAPPGASAGSSYGGRSPEERRSIERQTILKAAITVLDEIPEAGSDESERFFGFCDDLYAWLIEGQPVNPVPAASGATESAAEPGGGHEAAPTPTDDDIPY